MYRTDLHQIFKIGRPKDWRWSFSNRSRYIAKVTNYRLNRTNWPIPATFIYRTVDPKWIGTSQRSCEERKFNRQYKY